MEQRLLVTGFGPFPGMAENPSAAIARRVAASPRWRRLGVEAEALVLPTAYAALEGMLAPALRAGFDAVLMIGVAGRARTVRVERRADNRASILLPDAGGRRRTAFAFVPGEGSRRSTVAAGRVLHRLRRHSVPCASSQDAGRYLCNASYFAALAEPAPVVFLHIPKPPPRRPPRRPPGRPPRRSRRRSRASWPERLAAGFVEVAIDLLAEARRRKIGA